MLLLRRSVLKTEEPADPRQVARDAGLRYVCDEQAGIRRVRHGKGFIFIDAHGKPVRDEATLSRIRKLAIPPAWENVWICAAANGHIQAIGRDAAGRKQYRYHAMWATVRSAHKYDRLVEFAEALKKVRARVDKDLERPGIDRLRVIAAVVRLMDLTLMRVGNEEYADRHKHYGLTTMRDGHVKFRGDQLRFTFVGKSGQKHDIEATAPRLAKLVKRCQDLPGQQLFQYVDDDGEVRGISSEDVNDYLRETTGMNITAKDFRTWGGTVIAARLLAAGGEPETKHACNKRIVAVTKEVAEQLGNKPAVAKKYYMHPAVIDSYCSGTLAQELGTPRGDRRVPRRGLSEEEEAVVRLLKLHRQRSRMTTVELLEVSVRSSKRG